MTLKEWIKEAVIIDESNYWAVSQINVPEKCIVRESAFGPYRQDFPSDLSIASEEKDVVIRGWKQCEKYLGMDARHAEII